MLSGAINKSSVSPSITESVGSKNANSSLVAASTPLPCIPLSALFKITSFICCSPLVGFRVKSPPSESELSLKTKLSPKVDRVNTSPVAKGTRSSE